MYKITFNPATGKWEVKLNAYVFFWRKIAGQEFDNYGDTAAYVKAVGLDNVYKNYQCGFVSWVLSGGAA